MVFKRILPIFVLILVLSSFGFAQDLELVDRVIAVVNDEIILESEVLQFVQDIALRNRKAYRTQEDISKLRDNVLQELINQKILLAIAEADTNIVVEDRQVDKTLDDRINQVVAELGGEENLIEYYGKPVIQIRREFRKQVRDNLLVERVRNSRMQGVTVTKEEVEGFYNKHKSEMPELPVRVHISHILVMPEPTVETQNVAKAKADSLFERILAGDDFNTLAMKYSDDEASGEKGGLLGSTQRGDFLPAFEEVAYGLEEGEISQPIRTRFGYHIIRLNWRKGEKINSSHILVELAPTKDDKNRAIELIKELKTKLDNGANFAELAKEYSKDDETADKGGDLGWFDLPVMPDEFRIIAKGLKKDDISTPFRSSLGNHIIKMLDREEIRPVDLQKDWERISRLALSEKQEIHYREWLEKKRSEVHIETFFEEE